MEVMEKYVETIEGVFESCYHIENSEDLNRIMICSNNNSAKGKNLIDKFLKPNNELFISKCDIHLIGNDYERIVPKIISRRKKRLVHEH